MNKKAKVGAVMSKVEVNRALNLVRKQLKGAQSSCWKELKAASKSKNIDLVKEWTDRAARIEKLVTKFDELQTLIKQECDIKGASAKALTGKTSQKPAPIVKVKGTFQIGRVIHRYFPIVFSRRLVTQREIEVFLSDKSKSLYGTVDVPVLKISTGAADERFRKGIMRFYSDITLRMGGVSYLLSSQFITKKSGPILDWLASKGIDRNEMKRVGCGEKVPPSPYDKIDQLSIEKNV